MSKRKSTKMVKMTEDVKKRRPEDPFWEEYLRVGLDEVDQYVSAAILNSLRMPRKEYR